MDALDPQLRSQQQKPNEAFSDLYRYPPAQSQQSPYTLNPIRQLPPPQQPTSSSLPSITQDPSLPYYAAKQPDFALSDEQPDVEEQSPTTKVEGPEGQKRPRSCESCRALKVRCERDPSMTGPCKRCAKADRNCVFTEPSHKRKKKTDNKVAELEKKVDALTATLIAVQGGNVRASDDGGEEVENNVLKLKDSILADAKPSRKRRRTSYDRSQDVSNGSHFGQSAKQLAVASLSHPLATPIPPLENSFQNHEYADVIDRQVLTSATATEIFYYYKEKMAPYLPAVVIPPSATVGDIRREKPILFLAILSVASGHKHTNIQRILTREIMQTYADRVVNKGEKSLELIQAMQISTIWHLAEDSNDTRAFQLIQMAVAMSVAIKFTHENHYTSPEFGFRRNAQPLSVDNKEMQVEKKRAWLGCYLLSGISATSLNQPNPVLWSKFTDEAVNLLENAEEAAPMDKVLCRLAKLQRVSDQAVGLFFKDRSAADISKGLADLEKQTRQYAPDIDVSDSYSVKFMYKILLIYFTYLHVMITSLGESSGSSPPSRESKLGFLWKYGEPISDTTLKAGLPCMGSIEEALEIFLAVPQDHLDALPNIWFSRIAYLLIFLIFLTLRVIGADTGQQKTPDFGSMRVGEYLKQITEKLQMSGNENHSPAVHKFSMVLKMFKSWFERQRDGPRLNRPRIESQDASQLQAEPVDSERDTPRQGYRKLSVHSDSNSDNANKTNTKSPNPQVKHDTLAPTSEPKAAAPVAQMGNTPLSILSQVASNEPSASAQQQQQAEQQAEQQQQENWYNQITPYPPPPQPYVTDTQAYYPQQQDFTNGYGMDASYSQMAIDPELEQAMCSAFGSEGNMMGMFFNDFFSTGQGQNGMGYGNWYPTPDQ